MLDPQALYTLDVLLRKYHTLPIVGAHGFLTAAASSPAKRDIAVILPYLFGGKLPVFEAEDQDNVNNLLSALYKMIQTDLKDLATFDPLAFVKANEHADVDVTEKALQLWCIGYLHGARLDAEYWQDGAQQNLTKHFSPFIILAADDNIDALEDESIQNSRQALKEKAKAALYESVRKLYHA